MFISEVKPSRRREYSDQVIIKGEEHQEDDKDQTDLLGHLHFLDTDGPSQNRLQSQKEEVASIENMDGEKVDDPEVDAEDSHEESKVDKPFFCLLPCQLGNHDRSANRLCRDHPFDQFHDRDHG